MESPASQETKKEGLLKTVSFFSACFLPLSSLLGWREAIAIAIRLEAIAMIVPCPGQLDSFSLGLLARLPLRRRRGGTSAGLEQVGADLEVQRPGGGILLYLGLEVGEEQSAFSAMLRRSEFRFFGGFRGGRSTESSDESECLAHF